MSDKFNIDNESFIPEGLEFKQEYMDNAFALYGAAKKRLWRRKFYVYAGVVGLFISGMITLSVVYFNQSSQRIKTGELSAPVQTEPRAVSEKQPESNVKQSTFGNETKAEMNQVQKDKVVTSSLEIEEKSGNPRRTFDQGDSESSGSELPGQGSVSRDIKDPVIRLVNSDKKTKPSGQHNSKDSVFSVAIENTGTLDNSFVPDAANPDVTVNVIDESVNGKFNSISGNLEKVVSKQAVWAAPAVSIEKTGLIPIVPWKRWVMFFTAGMSPLAGYGSSNNRWKPDPMVSAGVEYKLHHGLSLSLAGRYYSISGITHPYLVEHTTYGQGFTTTTETYFTDRLHYAGINANISKLLDSKHQFSLGYSLDYLFTGNNRIVSSEVSTFENRDLGTRKAKGFVEGFESMNHSLRISYQYWLGNNKALGISYQRGLTDISKQEYFDRTDADRNSLLSVYFRMNLTK